VQEVIREIAQSQNVNVGAKSRVSFKVVVLTEVDKLSKGAQHALRRTMEKYMSSCRLILCCESACRVIGPLKSRCLLMRVPAPSYQQIESVLQNVAKKEKLTLPNALGHRIARASDRNLRRALLMLEGCKVEQYPLDDDQPVRAADWEQFLYSIGQSIVEEQSPQRLLMARTKMYELLTKCVPPETIIRGLTRVVLARLDDSLKHEVVQWAAFYEHRMQKGSKPIFHLEAFVAKFMALYKRWLLQYS